LQKPDFEKCTSLATDLLAKQIFNSTFINIISLNYDKRIYFDTIQNYCEITNTKLECFINKKTNLLKDGCLIVYDGIYLILYNKKIQSKEHLNWTLAHEIGHIYLGHYNDSKIEEIEAHYFAAQLLMPEYTIFQIKCKYKSLSQKDIYMLFNVSYEAAEKRIKTINKKTAFQGGYKHANIWSKQEDYIDFYYKYKSIFPNCNSDTKIQLQMSYSCDYEYFNNMFDELLLANC